MTNSFKRRIVFFLACCSLLSEGLAQTSTTAQQKLDDLQQKIQSTPYLKLNEPLPEFVLEDLIDRDITTLKNRLKGKPLIMDFWATWCAPCIKAFDNLNALQQQYESEVNFLYISDQKRYKIEHFLKRKSLQGIIGMDLDRSVFDEWGIVALPTTLFVDKDMRIKEIIIGNFSKSMNTPLKSKEALTKHLQTLIETTLDN